MSSVAETIELQAKSLDEAKKAAASKLGADIDQIEVTVLEETKGLFGKGSVRISARLKPVAEEEPAKPAKGKARAAKPKEEAKAVVEEAPVEASTEPESEEDTAEVMASEADSARLSDIVNEILDLAQLEASVRPTGTSGRYVNLELDGRDVAYLVGKHGEVLNAFQYILNVIASKQLANGVRVTLDGNQYRRRREQALENLAVKIAQQVAERGEEAVLDALPAFERRVVHKALQSYEGVVTYSEGEEPNRRVVIAPAE